MDFKKAREEMIRIQIEPRGITDKRILEAMRKIPREKFIEEKLWSSAYEDHPLPIGEGQTISQPYIVALMTQCLNLKGNEKVLEIGTGSGYQSAILAELTKEVYSVERFAVLSEKAKTVIEELGYKNVQIFTGDGTVGLRDFSPYDRIIVTAAAHEIPSALVEQLNDNGILVIPVGSLYSQELIVVEKKAGKIYKNSEGGCVFVPLIGKYGWQANEL